MKRRSSTVPLYKYVTFETLKTILEGSIRFTQPGAFNDPFEMVPELYVPEGSESEKLNIQFSVLAPRREPPVGTLDDDFVSDRLSDQTSRRILKELNQTTGILCLSRNRSSLLMWSHYADGYSGAIVEFDETHEFFTGHFDMKYSEHRPKIDMGIYTDSDEPVPIAELCVKSKEWEYEEEVRVARSLVDCTCVGTLNEFPIYVMDIPSDCIKSVILGERMKVSQQREIWNLVKDMPDVSLYLDAVANRGYEFRSEQIKLAGLDSPIISPRTAHIFKDQEGPIGEIAHWQIENHPLSETMNDTL